MPFYFSPDRGLTRRAQPVDGAIELQAVERCTVNSETHTSFAIRVFNENAWQPHGRIAVQLLPGEDEFDVHLAALRAAHEFRVWSAQRIGA